MTTPRRQPGRSAPSAAVPAAGGVLVLNLNFSVDKTASVPEFERSRVYRFASTISLPGGKGVNVSRALRELGLPSRLAGFAAGHNGRWIEEALAANGFDACVERHEAGESRMCLTVVDAAGASMDFNEEGPAVPAASQARLLSVYRRRLLPGARVLAVCGRTPAGLARGFYAELVRAAAARGCFAAFDVSGPALAEAVGSGADAVKINRDEFAELAGARFTPARFREYFSARLPRGLQTLIVTGGPDLTWAATPFGLWRVTPPALPAVKSPVGAGDSFMAGFVFGYYSGCDFEWTLALGAGAAASDCLSLGAGFIRRKEALAYARKARVEKIA